MEAIFENDTATGDLSVSGFDNFLPIQVEESVNEFDTLNEDTDLSPILSRKRKAEEGTTKTKRKRTQPVDEIHGTLSTLAESSKSIAQALQMQAAVDTLNHVNWQLIIEELQAMDPDLVDIIKVMKAFRSDDDLVKVFMSLTNATSMRTLV